jgi:hypothetical protein
MSTTPSNVIKQQMTTQCLKAVRDFLSSMPGANMCGAGASATEIKKNLIQIRAPGVGGTRYFEIIIKEAF